MQPIRTLVIIKLTFSILSYPTLKLSPIAQVFKHPLLSFNNFILIWPLLSIRWWMLQNSNFIIICKWIFKLVSFNNLLLSLRWVSHYCWLAVVLVTSSIDIITIWEKSLILLFNSVTHKSIKSSSIGIKSEVIFKNYQSQRQWLKTLLFTMMLEISMSWRLAVSLFQSKWRMKKRAKIVKMSTWTKSTRKYWYLLRREKIFARRYLSFSSF